MSLDLVYGSAMHLVNHNTFVQRAVVDMLVGRHQKQQRYNHAVFPGGYLLH